ncbi:MAG TPA: ABC-2 transporter permease [Thermoanaerobaculia bacterium]|nr:ABC-2 transporter permease [Thermoanaerobaculia bacterium]HUM28544.1 ABC-2 transporter permease [Thermoanaerobaculia bacterium]HXK66848.1 ABC-2 transporter permease [Thermoanaerobaculia bacterium]
MLRKILLYEYRMNRTNLFINGGLYLFYFAGLSFFDMSATLYVSICGLMSTMLPVTCLTREDKFGAGSLIVSLPITRRTIWNHRYAAAWISAGIMMTLALAIGWLNPWARVDLSGALTLPGILLALGSLAAFLALLMPFLVRYGFKGLFFSLIGAQLVSVLLFLLTIMPGTRRYVGGGVDGIVHMARSMRAMSDDPAYLLSMGFIILGLILVTYVMSGWLYARREL